MTQLSQRFTLEQFCAAAYHPELVQSNILAASGFMVPLARCARRAEDIEDLFGKKVILHSGYRFKALNDAVGSQDHSQHMAGEAFDFHVDTFIGSQDLLMQALRLIDTGGIPFHQLLIERGCLHLGLFKPGEPNGEIAYWAPGIDGAAPVKRIIKAFR